MGFRPHRIQELFRGHESARILREMAQHLPRLGPQSDWVLPTRQPLAQLIESKGGEFNQVWPQAFKGYAGAIGPENLAG